MLRKLIQFEPLKALLIIAFAGWAFTQWGYLWYATVFDDVWQHLIGRSETELIQMAETRGPIQTMMTYVISLVQAAALFVLCQAAGAKSFLDFQKVSGLISVLIATPVLGNAVLFAGQSTHLWALDFVHFILGYAGMALVFWMGLRTLSDFKSIA